MRKREVAAELSREESRKTEELKTVRRIPTKEKSRRKRRGLFAQPPKLIVKDAEPLPSYRVEALKQLIRKVALRKLVQMEHEQIKRIRAKTART